MTIQGIGGDIALRSDKPAKTWIIPFKHLVPGTKPLQLSSHVGPERFGVLNGLALDLVEILQVGRLPECGWGCDHIVNAAETFQMTRVYHGCSSCLWHNHLSPAGEGTSNCGLLIR